MYDFGMLGSFHELSFLVGSVSVDSYINRMLFKIFEW